MILFERLSDLSVMSEYGMILVYIFQLLAIAEVVHSLIGLVHASLVTTCIQVFGRLQVLYVVHGIAGSASSAASSGLLPMILAWASIEIVRYLYLALNVVRLAPYPLLWLRYTLFYILYPIGVFGEMKVLYDSLGQELPSADVGNLWNFYFSQYVRILLCVVYLPALYVQYTHMMRQRRIVLAKVGKSE